MIKPIEFQAWPKIARLNRDITVTEKIDGTNAAIIIVPWSTAVHESSEGHNWTEDYFRRWHPAGKHLLAVVGERTNQEFSGSKWVDIAPDGFAVFAQSRTRLLAPGQDNFGFAAWVQSNAAALVEGLGEGRHFGEWWGSGIQRGYDQPKGLKHFSLFNTHRHADTRLELEGKHGVSIVAPVPVLWHGAFRTTAIDVTLGQLRAFGSYAAPGYDSPEGVVVFHTAANICFKVLLEGDDRPKGQQT